MKKKLLTLLVIGLFPGVGLYYYFCSPSSGYYPDSTLIFKKYYPANEILGMANDESWRTILISKDAMESIDSWHSKAFNHLNLIENRVDEHCSRKAWQQETKKTTHVTVCDHGNYRTILTITPQL